MDVAESRSNGELLRGGRQFLKHLSELLLADAAVVNAFHHTTRIAKLGVESRLARATDSVNVLEHHHRDVYTRHDAESEEPPPAPPAPTQNRRSCETLSPAPEFVSNTRTISNCWAEEKCDITRQLQLQQRLNNSHGVSVTTVALRTPPYTTARPPNESPARRLPTIVAWCTRPNP